MKSVIMFLAVTLAGVALLSAAPARASLLLDYNFDEASSGTTNALNSGTLGSTADGVFNGAATRTNNTPGGFSPGALNLNPQGGNNEFVGPTTHLSGLAGLSDITVSTWLNVRSGNLPYSILGEDQEWLTGNGWAFYFSGAGSAVNLAFQLGATAKVATANVNANNTWVFVAMTWDQSSGDLKFYAGTPASAVAQVGSMVSFATTMTDSGATDFFRAGANPSGGAPNRIPAAYLDDFRVYNTVLDATSLDAVRVAGSPEPASLALLIVGGTMALARRRGSCA